MMTLDDKGICSGLKLPEFAKTQHVLPLSDIRAVGDYISGSQHSKESNFC